MICHSLNILVLQQAGYMYVLELTWMATKTDRIPMLARSSSIKCYGTQTNNCHSTNPFISIGCQELWPSWYIFISQPSALLLCTHLWHNFAGYVSFLSSMKLWGKKSPSREVFRSPVHFNTQCSCNVYIYVCMKLGRYYCFLSSLLIIML